MNAQSSPRSDSNGAGEPTKPSGPREEEYDSLLAAKNGDALAFELLCRQSANMVLNIARRMTRSKEEAEDVVQESLQAAFIHLRRFKGDSRFSTWLSRIAINAARMRLRKNHVRRELSLDESREAKQLASQLDVDQNLNPEQLYLQRERQQILFAAINELTPGMRRAIELRELEERSSEETARIMGISVCAAKARVFHGRRKLRGKLKSKFRVHLNENVAADHKA